MEKPRILRKRYIPDEIVDISGDIIIFLDKDLMVTEWKPIHPRDDISGGTSFSFLNEGYKISRFNGKNGEFAYWYCDIVDVKFENGTNTYTFTDLLADVKIMPDGRVIILDVEEIAQALEASIITREQACDALRKLGKLLEMIYSGNFPPNVISKFL